MNKSSRGDIDVFGLDNSEARSLKRHVVRVDNGVRKYFLYFSIISEKSLSHIIKFVRKNAATFRIYPDDLLVCVEISIDLR